MTGRYTPISRVARTTLHRTLIQSLPSTYSPRSPPPDDKLSPILERFRDLPPQPGLLQCVKKLRDAGFECWAVTNGAVESAATYFVNANVSLQDGSWFSGTERMQQRVISCDEIQAAKVCRFAASLLARLSFTTIA